MAVLLLFSLLLFVNDFLLLQIFTFENHICLKRRQNRTQNFSFYRPYHVIFFPRNIKFFVPQFSKIQREFNSLTKFCLSQTFQIQNDDIGSYKSKKGVKDVHCIFDCHYFETQKVTTIQKLIFKKKIDSLRKVERVLRSLFSPLW